MAYRLSLQHGRGDRSSHKKITQRVGNQLYQLCLEWDYIWVLSRPLRWYNSLHCTTQQQYCSHQALTTNRLDCGSCPSGAALQHAFELGPIGRYWQRLAARHRQRRAQLASQLHIIGALVAPAQIKAAGPSQA